MEISNGDTCEVSCAAHLKIHDIAPLHAKGDDAAGDENSQSRNRSHVRQVGHVRHGILTTDAVRPPETN